MTLRDYYHPFLEWEILNKPLSVKKIDDHAKLPIGHKIIAVNRDDEYNLNASLQFNDPSFIPNLQDADVPAGSIRKGFDIQGSNSYARFTFESCFLGKTEIGYQSGGQVPKSTTELRFRGVKMKSQTNEEGVHLIEWYLNGPRDHLFSGFTDRKIRRSYFRDRYVSEENKIDSTEASFDSKNFSTDFLLIKTSDFQFLISKVPKGIGPD